jgi:hypothetical protein
VPAQDVRLEGAAELRAELARLTDMAKAPEYIALVVPTLQYKILGWLSNGTRGGVARSKLLDLTPSLIKGMQKAALNAYNGGIMAGGKDAPWIAAMEYYRRELLAHLPNIPHATKRKSTGELSKALERARIVVAWGGL